MAEPGEKQFDDWVRPTKRIVNLSGISLDKFEKHVKRGLEVIRETDGTGIVTGKIVIKGSRKDEQIDVSK